MARALEAAVFDLDGVVTRTARVHLAAWTQVFDDFLAQRPAGADHRPFTEADYREYVDGRPRLDGVKAFLASRGLPPEPRLVAYLAERKNARFNELLDELGVEVDPDAVALIRALQVSGVPVGMATSSRNAPGLLRRAGLEHLFDARVDGNGAAALGLRGKPHPDTFLECLRRLRCSDPGRALLVEDAAPGVEAGRAGGFGLVVGVDRGGNARRLWDAGAHRVVRSLGELSVAALAAGAEAHP